MQFDVQKAYDKNLAELKNLVEEHNKLEAQMKEIEEHYKQLAGQKQQLYVAAMAKQEVVKELQPFVKTEEIPQIEQPVEPKVEEKVAEKKSRK